ncbi:MAG: hypothetical protein KAV45_09475 [Calditrichia bacterium]|nr:hypothetical protein [Calditrichia bacterium]
MRLINMLIFFVIGLLLTELTSAGSLKDDMALRGTAIIKLPESFPQSSYTPYGYIDNPYHSMVFNRSGVIRSVPPLGFGYWKRKFWGSYAEGPRDHVNYLSLLQLSVAIDRVTFLELKDFETKNIEIYSAYHTKHLMSYEWKHNDVGFSFKYFLPRENSLVCFVEIENLSDSEKDIVIHATNIYGLWENKWWGSNGLSAEYLKERDVSVSKIWAYGDVFILSSEWNSIAHASMDSESHWKEWIENADLFSNNSVTVKGSGPIYNAQSYRIALPAKTKESGLIFLSRGKNEIWALQELQTAQKESIAILKKQLAEDEKFWSNCPKLEGDWPIIWKHGWVYDWETLRMNIRRPTGIFNHPWDAMQVHSPRLVLGETALDMLTMSYADPELSKQVIYGTFADALAPNIPCAREDGSVNMIGADGSECGTAPMWGFPFHVIQTIFASTGDTVWIKNLYPHLKAYLEWWLDNRTDEEGWFHCNNSWESGQDGSRRFLVKGEGDPATFVRTVDVEASVAEAMKIMEFFSPIAGRTEDQTYWKSSAQKRTQNTRSMFVDGWFCDFDGRNNQPIHLKDFYDIMMLTPLTCGIATEEQIREIKPMFQYYLDNPVWLQWPPKVFAFTEAAWNAGEQLTAAEAVYQIANRIYQRTDMRSIMFSEKNQPFSYRIPGVANEFWPVDFRPPGGENYGWGAILPMFIIRNITGFHESDENQRGDFYLMPCIPAQFNEAGKEYGITGLRYRHMKFDVSYKIKQGGKIEARLILDSSQPIAIRILNQNGQILFSSEEKKNMRKISFEVQNGRRYRIESY